jgi:hypothetical protein
VSERVLRKAAAFTLQCAPGVQGGGGARFQSASCLRAQPCMRGPGGSDFGACLHAGCCYFFAMNVMYRQRHGYSAREGEQDILLCVWRLIFTSLMVDGNVYKWLAVKDVKWAASDTAAV